MLIYVGNGHYLVGVPARDLTDEDIAAVEGFTKKQLIATGLYIESDKEKPHAAENKQAAGPQENK